MRYVIAIIVILSLMLLYVLSYYSRVQTVSPSPSDSLNAIIVNITWSGTGPVELMFDDDAYIFSEGETKSLHLIQDHLYTLKSKFVLRQYIYKDYLRFEKSRQSIAINFANDALSIAEPDKILTAIDTAMVLVSGGTFYKGCANTYCSRCDDWERRNNDDSTVLNDFYIAKYDVTQEQWEGIMGYNPSHFKGCNSCPVESVSWTDAQKFIQKINSLSAHRYRLPTDAEWEYAARGGVKRHGDFYSGKVGTVAWNEISGGLWEIVTGHKFKGYESCTECMLRNLTWEDAKEFVTKLNEKQEDMNCPIPTQSEWEQFISETNNGNQYAGGNNLHDLAWYYGNADYRTHPVGQKMPNELGLYDMNGNVWQWCSDWWLNDDWNYGTNNPANKNVTDPADPKNPFKRVVHGSPWWMTYSRLTFLFGYGQEYRFNDTGFRLVRDK